MSHEVETMAYAGETPWHGLGKRVIDDLTPEQMLVEAGLDWKVEKIPAYITFDGEQVYSGSDALVRSTDGNILTMVSDNWEPVQNQTAFEFFNEFIMEGNIRMHTAGSLKHGKMVWALAQINESFELFGGDKVSGYLLFSNPHEYGKSIDVRFTPIRVVCNNTLTLAVSSKAERMVRVSHRRSFDPEYVKETLGIAHSKMETYKEMAQFLGSKRYTNDLVKKYFSDIFPSVSATEDKASRNARLAYTALDTQPGANYAEGSWWSAFNAVTFLVDHKIGRNNETRLYSSWYGPNHNKKIQALEKAIEYAEAA